MLVTQSKLLAAREVRAIPVALRFFPMVGVATRRAGWDLDLEPLQRLGTEVLAVWDILLGSGEAGGVFAVRWMLEGLGKRAEGWDADTGGFFSWRVQIILEIVTPFKPYFFDKKFGYGKCLCFFFFLFLSLSKRKKAQKRGEKMFIFTKR